MYIWENIQDSSKGKENNLGKQNSVHKYNWWKMWLKIVEGEKQAEKDNKNTEDIGSKCISILNQGLI